MVMATSMVLNLIGTGNSSSNSGRQVVHSVGGVLARKKMLRLAIPVPALVLQLTPAQLLVPHQIEQ